MPFYIDTSALVPLYTEEPHSRKINAFVTRHGSMTISHLAIVEFKSALCRKVLRREISADEIESLFGLLLDHVNKGFYRPAGAHEETDYEFAMRIIGKPPHKVRALDGLHIAMAARLDLDVLTCDHVLANAVRDNGANAVFIDPNE